jgi:hypothetical protein
MVKKGGDAIFGQVLPNPPILMEKVVVSASLRETLLQSCFNIFHGLIVEDEVIEGIYASRRISLHLEKVQVDILHDLKLQGKVLLLRRIFIRDSRKVNGTRNAIKSHAQGLENIESADQLSRQPGPPFDKCL